MDGEGLDGGDHAVPRRLDGGGVVGWQSHTVPASHFHFMHLWCERDGGGYWPWDWTILRLVIGKQEVRTDLALNNWGLGVVMHETNDWSIHIGPLDVECEYDKFYDDDDEWLGPAHLRLLSKVRDSCPCERQLGRDPARHGCDQPYPRS